MGDYFKHWMKMGKKLKNKPRIFHVNWFRKDEKGNFYGLVFAIICEFFVGLSRDPRDRELHTKDVWVGFLIRTI